MNTLVELSSIEAQLHWPEAEEYLSQAVKNDYDSTQLRIIKGRVFAGMNTLWRIDNEEGAAIAWGTTFIYTADGNTIVAQIYVATTDDLNAIIEKFDEFENWAHVRGVHYIEVVGRLGWSKPLRALGFEHNYTSLTREVYRELH
jgi:hypothetical protein